LLSRYEVSPHPIRIKDELGEDKVPRGFYRSDFEDAFSRYLTAPTIRYSATTRINASENADLASATDGTCSDKENTYNVSRKAACSAVAFPSPLTNAEHDLRIFDMFEQPLETTGPNATATVEGDCEVLPDGRCKCPLCGSVFGSFAGYRAHIVRRRCTPCRGTASTNLEVIP
jgi:hypothetical protein